MDPIRDYTDAGFDPESGLPVKQRLFCDHYLSTMNRRQAYTAAGYIAETPEAALINATALLNSHNVKEWVTLKTQQRANMLGVRADNVLAELVIIATASPVMFQINPNTGRIEVVPGVPVEYLKAVGHWESSSVTRTRTNTDGSTETSVTWSGKFRLVDKLKALQLLCNHLGLTEAELPPLEVLLNRLNPRVAGILREMLANPALNRPKTIMDTPPEPEQPGK